MYYLSLILLLILQPSGFMNNYEDWYRNSENFSVQLNNKDWDNLLQKYVDEEGNVDYKGFKGEEAVLNRYLNYLSEYAPSDLASKEEKLVYYINLYNAATVKLIVDNYPVASIKDIKGPWDKKWVEVGANKLSLGAIEHKILRKMDEPRIHFAINCASYSCPKLSNQAYSVSKLESQLEAATSDFVNDEKRNRINGTTAQVSEIFKWYKADFTENGDLVEYINKYSETPIARGTKVQYLKYDWSLNERE